MDGIEREREELDPPAADREQDAQFLDRVDTALDRHRQNRDPSPARVHETVIHTQPPTPDPITGPLSPAAPPTAAEARHDASLKPASSAATAQFFGAGGSMCVRLWVAQIASDLSLLARTGCVGLTNQHSKVARRLDPPVLHPRSWVLEIRVRGLERVGGAHYCDYKLTEAASCSTRLYRRKDCPRDGQLRTSGGLSLRDG
jgi:hypothetical protein